MLFLSTCYMLPYLLNNNLHIKLLVLNTKFNMSKVFSAISIVFKPSMLVLLLNNCLVFDFCLFLLLFVDV